MGRNAFVVQKKQVILSFKSTFTLHYNL